MGGVQNEIFAYRTGHAFDMKLTPAPSDRDWMDRANVGFANRCLPMRMANQAGWMVLNDRPLRAKWLGGGRPSDVVIEHTGEPPYAAIAHFGEGILTFTTPFLFRTQAGSALLFRGPANSPKDAIAPLEGLVETDWAVAAVSMNWKFTRPETWVTFAPGEPICMIVPQCLNMLETARPQILDLEQNPDLQRHHRLWQESCQGFADRLQRLEPEAVKLGWQRYYFRGTAPHAGSQPIPEAREHRTRLKLRTFIEPA